MKMHVISKYNSQSFLKEQTLIKLFFNSDTVMPKKFYMQCLEKTGDLNSEKKILRKEFYPIVSIAMYKVPTMF